MNRARKAGLRVTRWLCHAFRRAGSAVAVILVTALSFAPAPARAAATAWAGDARGSARLITAVEATGSGTRFDAALELRLAPGWHTYWRTPGDAGLATAIDWSGSENLAGAEIAWPAPVRLTIEGLENYVYLDRVVLPVTLTLAHPGAPLRLHAVVDYASCEKICIPYQATFDLALPAGLAAPGPEAPLIAEAASQVPGFLAKAGLRLVSATLSGSGAGGALAVVLASEAGPFRAPDLFVEGVPLTAPAVPHVAMRAAGREAALTVPLATEAAKGAAGRELTFTVTDGARSAEFRATPTPGTLPAPGYGPLLGIVGIAFLGGLILNVMPCVLPVLSLKLLSVAGYAGSERRRVRAALFMTAAGVVASFVVIAAVLIGSKLAGAAVGWGIQFQQPWFLAAMAAMMTLFAANLWGLLPIGLPGIAAAAGNVRSRYQLLDAFVAGAVATLLATSCSAPFVGTAVGFALARGPVEIGMIFAALGIGMAAPLLAVAAAPGLVLLLPRPGRWMIVLRRVLGVGLAGTAVWLLWVLAEVAGPLATLAAAGALAAFVAMLGLRAVVSRPATRRVAAATAAVLAGVSVLAPVALTEPILAEVAQAPRWRSFDSAENEREVRGGKIVFVDVTAVWCLTCKLNEVAVLDRSPVADRLKAADVIAMRADWTRPDPRITEYLQSFGRYGVPLNVVYGPGRPNGEALPELLTTAAVMEALARAAGTPMGLPAIQARR